MKTSDFKIPTAADFEIMAAEAGTNISVLCRRADVARNTFQNWKNGKDAKIDTVKRLMKALEDVLADEQNLASH